MSAVASRVELLFNHPVRFLASLVPALLALVLVLLANLPVSFTGGLLPVPALALACVYFWVLVRPDGYVGAIVTADSAAALESYLREVGVANE